MQRSAAIAFAVAFLGLAEPWVARAADESFGEYEVKAAFLYNFARFVEWPDPAPAAEEPVEICVLGEDPFGEVLDRTIAKKKVRGHPVVARRIEGPDDAATCRIVFVSASEERLRPTLETLAREQTLTVGEDDDFTKQGGMIKFLLDERRVRLEINVDALERAGLKASSQLLRVARVVRRTKEGF